VYLYGNSGPTGPFLTSAKGDLTSKRSEFVNDNKLAEFYEKTRLTQHLRISAGQEHITPRMLAQAYEAIVGAIFLDADYEMAGKIVRLTMFPWEIARTSSVGKAI
jgi:dsRNA-specific ribonuclease